MPDWTYQTLFRPLLFQLPARQARMLTLRGLEALGKYWLGPQLIALMGHTQPSPALARSIAGVRLPAPVGIGADLAGNEHALGALARFGAGYVELGPAALAPQAGLAPERHAGTATILLRGQALVAADALAGQLKRLGPLPARIMVRLGQRPEASPAQAAGEQAQMIAMLAAHVDLFSLAPMPAAWGNGEIRIFLAGVLESAAAQGKGVLVGIEPDSSLARLEQVAGVAAELGAQGLLICGGIAGPEGTRLLGAPALSAATAATRHLRARWGEQLAISVAGGAQEPGQALALLDAGADMVQLDAGLVFGGPGLPKRINEALGYRTTEPQNRRTAEPGITEPQNKRTSEQANKQAFTAQRPASDLPPAGVPPPSIIRRPSSILLRPSSDAPQATSHQPQAIAHRLSSIAPGWLWILLLGMGMIVGGCLAWLIAATSVVLPYDEAFVGMSRAELAAINPRLLLFMAHDRVALAGTMISIGALYAGLASSALRRREHWAAVAVAASASAGFASFFLFLGYGYLDPLHALAALGLLPLFLLGMRARFDAPPHVPAPDLYNDRAWRLAQWGQLGFVGLGLGLTGAGLAIALVGATEVFVPEDLAFLCTTPQALRAANDRLLALVAHDRAGFGGALVADGVAVLLIGLWGIRRGARWVWWTLLLGGAPGFAAALGIHAAVGYLDLWHLTPGLVGLAVFLVSLALLRPYLNGGRWTMDEGR